jgi:photosystem II stability/assembly factor-like uncharacterized protein
MVRVFRTAALAAFAFALASCSGNSTTSPLVGPFKSIIISAPTDTATYNSTIPFSAAVIDTNGNPVSAPAISWSSSNTAVAIIDTRGVLTPKLEGTTTILAKGGGATSNPIAVTVIPGFGWVDETPGALNLLNLNGVHFVDRLHGWAVGDQGTILSTSNAGLSWVKENSQSTSYTLNAVFFATGSHGFVVGSAGRILESTDGGLTWAVRTGIDTNNGASLNDIAFVDDKTGFIVGNGGLILRTKDGGASWTHYLPAVTSNNLLTVSATFQPGPDTTAWALGASGVGVDTEDGGATWQVASTPFLTDATGVTRPNRDQAFAVGVGNVTATTVGSPAGPEWVLAPTPPTFTNFYGVSWPTPVQLMAVGENTGGTPTILRSLDQGTTWVTQNLPTSAVLSNHGLRDVWFTDHDHGWAVGKSGAIVHTATGGNL